MSFAGYVRSLMDQRAISLRSLAARAGVSPAHLSRVLRDPKTKPSAAFVDALATGLEHPYSILLYQSGHYVPDPASRQRFTLEQLHTDLAYLLSALLFLVHQVETRLVSFLTSCPSMSFFASGLTIERQTELHSILEAFEKVLDEREYQELKGRLEKLIDSVRKSHPQVHVRRPRVLLDETNANVETGQTGADVDKTYLSSFKELFIELFRRTCVAILTNRNPAVTMEFVLSQSRYIDPDEFLFLSDLIPDKYYLTDHTPHFAQKLDRLSAWLNHAVQSYVQDQKEGGLGTLESLTAFWAFYLDPECREAFFSEQEHRAAPPQKSRASEGQLPQVTGTEEEERFSLKVEYRQGVTTITLALRSEVEEALPLIHQFVVLLKQWAGEEKPER